MNLDTDIDEQPQAPAPFPVRVDWGDHEWDWNAKDDEKWVLAPPQSDWQVFMDCWLDQDRAADLHKSSFPHELQIFPKSHFDNPSVTMNRFRARPLLSTLRGKMLVLERYAYLYHSLKRNRERWYRGGVVLGGQPGIGKSLLLWYFLVRLIQDRQPVVLHLPASASPAILFYHCQAWYCESFQFQGMPSGPQNPYNKLSRPIFVLVDSAVTDPPGMIETMGWPIYAASSKPGRSREFMKERFPLMWGLDLWTSEQLREGLKLQVEWPEFVRSLARILQGETVWGFKYAVSIKDDPKYTTWPKSTVDDLIEIFLDNAIYWVGRAARNVFGTILTDKDPTLHIPLNPLANVASLLTGEDLAMYRGTEPISHQTLALQLPPHKLHSDRDSVFDFIIKTQAIREVMAKNVSRSDDATILPIFTSLRALPGCSVLAGHVFADYAIGRMSVANPVLPLKPMNFHSGTVAQPRFSAEENEWSMTPDGVYPDYPRPSLTFMSTKGVKRRVWQELNYKNGPLEAGVFYVPIATSHPLFDAFFLENANTHGVLWVIQFTTSHEHGSAVKELSNVRRLLRLAKYTISEVHVRWVLVIPTSLGGDDGVSDRKWQMPAAWNETTLQNDHRGYFWLQEIDMTNCK